MEVDELFEHALCSLPDAVGDLLRDGKDPSGFVFVTLDGASDLGRALITMDIARGGHVLDDRGAEAEVDSMLRTAADRGEGLVVSLMVTCEAVLRLLMSSTLDADARIGVALWLERQPYVGHLRVLVVAGAEFRVATVDATSEMDEAPATTRTLR